MSPSPKLTLRLRRLIKYIQELNKTTLKHKPRSLSELSWSALIEKLDHTGRDRGLRRFHGGGLSVDLVCCLLGTLLSEMIAKSRVFSQLQRLLMSYAGGVLVRSELLSLVLDVALGLVELDVSAEDVDPLAAANQSR